MSKCEYHFQFNNDEESCVALRDMIVRGWTVQGFKQEGGYTWFILVRELGM